MIVTIHENYKQSIKCLRLLLSRFSSLQNGEVSERLKPNKALDENSSLSYGASPAIWDHTVLPATRHK